MNNPVHGVIQVIKITEQNFVTGASIKTYLKRNI